MTQLADAPAYEWEKPEERQAAVHGGGLSSGKMASLAHRKAYLENLQRLNAQSDGHHCHATGCTKPTRVDLLMCFTHWSMVPRDLQRAVWQTYRPGQETDKSPSRAWLDAAHAAIDHVARAEARRLNGHLFDHGTVPAVELQLGLFAPHALAPGVDLA